MHSDRQRTRMSILVIRRWPAVTHLLACESRVQYLNNSLGDKREHYPRDIRSDRPRDRAWALASATQQTSTIRFNNSSDLRARSTQQHSQILSKQRERTLLRVDQVQANERTGAQPSASTRQTCQLRSEGRRSKVPGTSPKP